MWIRTSPGSRLHVAAQPGSRCVLDPRIQGQSGPSRGSGSCKEPGCFIRVKFLLVMDLQVSEFLPVQKGSDPLVLGQWRTTDSSSTGPVDRAGNRGVPQGAHPV